MNKSLLLGAICASALVTLSMRHGEAGTGEPNGTGIAWNAPSPSNGSAAAIGWEKSFSAAKVRAARERKPILLLHLFGRLDEDLC